MVSESGNASGEKRLSRLFAEMWDQSVANTNQQMFCEYQVQYEVRFKNIPQQTRVMLEAGLCELTVYVRRSPCLNSVKNRVLREIYQSAFEYLNEYVNKIHPNNSTTISQCIQPCISEV
jgi:hypothetical protein